MRRVLAAVALMLPLVARAASPEGASNPALAAADSLYPDLEKLYLDLHQTPELSNHEEKTSAKLAARLKTLGYEVTTGVGGFGVVAILKNGQGPTVLLREDMDALPVQERTGLAYASKVTTKDDSGATVSVMHACGHDIHMTGLIGAATLLVKAKDRWRGTLILVAQPAEEKGNGATAMIKDGLFTKFPKPDFAISFHDSAMVPAGKVTLVGGYANANVDSVDLTIYGRGGHGAYPHTTVDPIVIAARTVVALQTIVSREIKPTDPAVVTVGAIHAGTKHNIIPDEAKLMITVRTYKTDVREKILAAIDRIAKAEALAADAPKPPKMELSEGTSAVYNDPALTKRISDALARTLGASNVEVAEPVMGSEDFSEFARAGIPSLQYNVGAVNVAKYEASKKDRTSLPSLHSSEFAPDPQPTIKTSVISLTAAALEVLGKP